jgi:uncharacterized RDD family membrane protein YckC
MRYRTFLPRIFAGLIDGLVFLPEKLLIDHLTNADPAINQYLLLALEAIFAGSFIMYRLLLHLHTGQTLGKMFVEVKVLDISENRPLTFHQAFVREIYNIVYNVPRKLDSKIR